MSNLAVSVSLFFIAFISAASPKLSVSFTSGTFASNALEIFVFLCSIAMKRDFVSTLLKFSGRLVRSLEFNLPSLNEATSNCAFTESSWISFI